MATKSRVLSVAEMEHYEEPIGSILQDIRKRTDVLCPVMEKVSPLSNEDFLKLVLGTLLDIGYVIKAPEKPSFRDHGHLWTMHKPGDEMPCDRKAMVHVLVRSDLSNYTPIEPKQADFWFWHEIPDNKNDEIVGWRYA